MFSKKATKIDEIFTINLTVYSKRQINGKDFVNFRGLLRKHELYQLCLEVWPKTMHGKGKTMSLHTKSK